MGAIELLELMKKLAIRYRTEANASIVRNRRMNDRSTTSDIPQEDIDAILTDFINFVGVRNGVDYGLYSSDLHSEGPYIIK